LDGYRLNLTNARNDLDGQIASLGGISYTPNNPSQIEGIVALNTISNQLETALDTLETRITNLGDQLGDIEVLGEQIAGTDVVLSRSAEVSGRGVPPYAPAGEGLPWWHSG
jgi:hypothetical protein